MDGHACLLAFDTEEREFARGFEIGRLWALLRMSPPEDEITEYAHGKNAEMLLRMGEATGRRVTSEELGDEWLLATFSPCELQEP